MWTRELKPGFWRNECLGGLPCYARLTAVGLPGLADREGRLENRPGKIKGELFPFDADVTAADVESWLAMLESIDFIRRYTVDGVGVIAITNFHKHQHIHPRERQSSLPGITENSRELPVRASELQAALSSLSALSLQKLRPLAGANDPPTTCEANVQGNKPEPISTSTSTSTHEPKPTPDDVVALWHELMYDLPRVRQLTSARRVAVATRIRQDLPTEKHWRRYFAYIRTRPFLMGKVKPTNGHSRGFRPNLFWFCKPENYAKISEDYYDA